MKRALWIAVVSALVLMLALPVSAEELPIKVGDKAPDFTLESSDGGTVSLKDFKGKKIVFWFYPKDDTPDWTIQANDFRERKHQFEEKNAIVLGLSKDSIESHKKFIEKFDLNFALLSDPDGTVCTKYGACSGKESGVARMTVIIDEEGVIKQIYTNVRALGHAKRVLLDL